jgi:hypothetical protein
MTHSVRLMLPAVAGLLAAAGPAAAAWNNVFQVVCHDCNRPRASYSVPVDPCPQPCAQPEARVSYVQRSYYQPVTEMRRESYYVPVKENVTSYYYEPVTSYSYTSYYDPCSCTCQEIAVPKTSYRLRQQCNTVTKYVEKCRMVPVTSYRQVTMYQPVVTYYYPPSTSMYTPPIPGAVAAPPAAAAADPQQMRPPVVTPGGSDGGSIPPPNVPTTPNSLPRQMPPAGKPEAKANPGFARTASRQTGSLRGEVVLNDQATPRPGTKLVFLSAADGKTRIDAVTNGYGEFDVKLPAGEWYVYLGQGNGRADYYKKIRVQEFDARNLTLVSR